MKQKKSDDAVSPVIGVMLMIVITVVIAGVIAAFGTGMTGNVEAAPNVMLDVKIISNFGSLEPGEGWEPTAGTLIGPDFQIRHVAGDPLKTEDIEIRMAWSATDGAHYSTYSAAEYKKKNPPSSTNRNQPMYVKTAIPGFDTMTDQTEYPYGSGYSGTGLDWYFGDAVMTPGMRLTASTEWLSTEGGNIGSPFMDIIFNNGVGMGGSKDNPGIMKYLPEGTPVEITILHIPSNTIIYENEVIVQ